MPKGDSRFFAVLAAAFAAMGCRSVPDDCPTCGTIVVAAVGEPERLLPPLVWESVGRDISDLVFDRLAVLEGGHAPTDPAGYRPSLAVRWEPVDSLAWRFILRRGARWHDGRPVAPDDVVFSIAAWQESVLDAPGRSALDGVVAIAESDSTVVVRFPRAYPEQLYDATWHVRVLPRHVWDTLSRSAWAADTSTARLVGSGPFRVVRRDRGQSLILERVAKVTGRARRVVWRFTDNPEAAANLVLGHEADVLETVFDPSRLPQFERDTSFALYAYPSAVYGYLGFQMASGADALGDPLVRLGLALVIDREHLATVVLGPGAVVPDGPLSRMLWLWEDRAPLPADTVSAGRLLDSAGWVRGRDRVRRRAGRPLAVDILVPATSTTRRSLAIAIQERWTRLGVKASVSAVDFPVFQERLGQGKFDSYVGAWLDEPSPRGLVEQWTAAGWDRQNYGRYNSPAFDSALAAVLASVIPAEARARWREAMAILERDRPAVFLYTPTNTAVVARRIGNVTIDPYSWARTLPEWTVTP
jgi:peptide/nickel transport system substrate-binding protein